MCSALYYTRKPACGGLCVYFSIFSALVREPIFSGIDEDYDAYRIMTHAGMVLQTGFLSMGALARGYPNNRFRRR